MYQRCGSADVFAAILDRLIRDEGGAGNLGQLHVLLAGTALDVDALALGWKRLGEQAWPLGAHIHHGLRGMRMVMQGPAALTLERRGHAADCALEHLRQGTGTHAVRLALVDHADNPALVLTWNHTVIDARAAAGLLAELPALAGGRRLREDWWRPGYREVPGVPERAAERGRLAQQALELLRPHRLVELWRPLPRQQRRSYAPNRALPLVCQSETIGASDAERLRLRQRQAAGRMSETPFLLACVAAALESLLGIRGDVLMPLAVDLRAPGERRMLANCHGYCFLRVPAGLASTDLAATCHHLKQAHREWIEKDGVAKLSSSMSWFGYLPHAIAQAQLGNHGPGVWSSCIVANSGPSTLPESLFGARVLGVSHAATIPATPGLGVLFHRDQRGLSFDALACGKVLTHIQPQALARAIRWQLLERPIPAAAPA
jgi:hypothetical protein